ncbi:hypothetical protein MN116_008679 [Schistosoma mekongi]|uniref:tRNA-intron lyase n=1 Tax=Schistosoma mekongi TaxID=38744 RepID=A0AAE1Z5I5_SCHME|nr:hypothetical protein MN116_008679 [Schistosoma mekongi]
MESFLGRPKPNKLVHLAGSSASVPSCIPSHSTLPFPILMTEDFSQLESDQGDNSVNKAEQFTFQAVLLNFAKTLITDTTQISILRNRGCYGFSQNSEYNLHNPNSNSLSREYNTDDDDDEGDHDNYTASDADNSVDNTYFSKVIRKTNEKISGETDVSGLVLSDVETLFLLHGLGCLDVYLPSIENLQFHSTTTATKYQHLEPLSLTEVWFYLCTGSANAPCLQLQTAREQIEKYSQNELSLLRRYAVYIYYRSKGWIVRPGLCVGGADYLLYAEGPNWRHAAFCVLVDRDSRTNDGDQLNCASVAAHVRVAHSVDKRVILCRVSLPSIEEFSHNPWEAVRKTTIKETLIDYWKPNAR